MVAGPTPEPAVTMSLLAALAAALLSTAAEGAAPPSEPAGAPRASAAAATPATAPAVYLGAGLGLSSAIQGGDGGGSMVRLRFGVIRAPTLHVGLEGGVDRDGGERRAVLGVGATWFPWSGGTFVRGGVGMVARAFSSPGSTTSLGPSLQAGLGHAFGDRAGLDLTLNLEAQQQLDLTTGGQGGEGDLRLALWLGLDWF